MPATPSRRLGLHGPVGGDPVAIPDDMLRLRDQLDDIVLGYDQGVLSARPGAGLEGRLYYARDTRAWYYDTGTAWETIGAVVEPAVVVGSGGSAPAFNAGWGHSPPDMFGTPGQVRFWRHGTRVHLAGTAKRTSGGVLMFTLPDGYRPTSQVRQICYANAGFEPGGHLLIVETNGVVYEIDGSATVSLDGITFDMAR